jgi:hypothetical protein
MIHEHIKVVPEIQMKTHPVLKVYGRGNEQLEIGKLVYVEADNGHSSTYNFQSNGTFLTAKTLREIAYQIDLANYHVGRGLL